jgi:hypothetical protein
MNILDLEPAQFLAALDELGIAGDQRDALVAQYTDPSRGYERDERAFLTRLADNVIGFDDGVETQGERIGQSVGTFFDAVREDPLGVAGDMVTGLYGDIERGVRGELSPFETFELAGILALPAAGARFDPTVARMFGGRGTTNEYADRAMDRAEALRDQGLSPEDIWRTTAEEFPDAPATVLPDGRPFYEMPDAEALTQSLAQDRAQTLTSQALQATDPEERALLINESGHLLNEQPASGVLSTPLVDVMSHPQLYQDFPEVENIRTQMAASLPSNVGGYYYPPASSSTAGVVQVSSRYRDRPESQAGVLLHEVQHGIGGVTRELPEGANPDVLQTYITRLENRLGQPRNDAVRESENLIGRLDNLESYFANEGPEALQVYQQVVDPLYGAVGTATEAAGEPHRALIDLLYSPTGGVTRGFQTQDPSYALYYMDPGEAIARVTDARREMSMAERRATSPMETLRQERRPIEWDELTQIRSEDGLRDYLQGRFNADLSEPRIEGVDPYSYFRALNRTVSNSHRIVNETVDELSGVTDEASRRRIIAEARDLVRNDLRGRLERLSSSAPEY